MPVLKDKTHILLDTDNTIAEYSYSNAFAVKLVRSAVAVPNTNIVENVVSNFDGATIKVQSKSINRDDQPWQDIQQNGASLLLTNAFFQQKSDVCIFNNTGLPNVNLGKIPLRLVLQNATSNTKIVLTVEKN